MQANSLLLREIHLFEFQLGSKIKQSELLLLLGNHFIEERQMIAEKQNGGRIIDLRIFSYVVLEKDSRHRRYILVTEPQIGPRKTGVPRLHRGYAHFAFSINHVA